MILCLFGARWTVETIAVLLLMQTAKKGDSSQCLLAFSAQK